MPPVWRSQVEAHEIHRGKRLEVRLSLALALSSKQVKVPCTCDTARKTFGPTDLTSTYSVCTRRVFGSTGIEPRPSGLESVSLTTRLPTTP
ncbi:hypothetical protein TNCV_2565311 [Trichonephila clavipes]|uniref:Uncharacterized protein n=1 Tax=Trichonephila clavipes TaxID=2585209 RepID=A0A8X6SP84_TRICX|nr:hypothetical protein TNCV_2565311 [Trichonephila clavipes]